MALKAPSLVVLCELDAAVGFPKEEFGLRHRRKWALDAVVHVDQQMTAVERDGQDNGGEHLAQRSVGQHLGAGNHGTIYQEI